MKNLISKFSSKLLSNQQLKTVKGGDVYCYDQNGGGAAPTSAPNASGCTSTQYFGVNGQKNYTTEWWTRG